MGVGREDGKAAGEFVAIFYRRSAVTLQECDTFWLSPTPHVPSKFPGAGCIRCTTRARFITKTGGKVLTVMCTHWDHVSDGQRALAASLILYRGAHEAAVTGAPVFVLGDFNSPSDGADSSGYNIMTGNMEPVTIDKRFKREYSEGNRPDSKWVYKDVAQETAPLGRSGHHASFTDFKKHARMDHTRIDFVMAGGECWKSERYRVGESFWEGEDMGSDHRPVWADVVIG